MTSATPVAPEARSAFSPARLFGVLAAAEAVTWTLLLIGMLLKYVLHVTDLGVRLGGGVHGFVFLCYVAVTLLVAIDRRWARREVVLGLGSSILPYMTIPFERSARRRGLLADRWRLSTDEGNGPIERIASLVLRHPIPAALVTLLVLAAVFSGLLVLGPPTQWFA